MKAIAIEDHQMFLDLVAEYAKRAGLDVLGRYTSAPEGWRGFIEHQPEIVLLDLDLKGEDGLALAEQMLKEEPRTRILAISSRCDEYTLYRVLNSGLMGFVDKQQEGLDVLEHAIREVLGWRFYYASVVTQVKLSQYADPKAFPKILTPREQELLCLFGVGLSNQDVAETCKISPATAKLHRQNIMNKLGINSTPELIRYALAKGFARASEIRVD